MKTIKITCRGAATAKLEELIPLQGGLKTHDATRLRKLRKEILGPHGFSFPFDVWKAKDKLFIIDGHGRDVMLRQLKRQGYDIPPLPISYIDARDEKEAREKILAKSSQYGEMTDESLLEYLKESDIELEDVIDTVDLPTVDLDKLNRRLEEELAEAKVQALEYQYEVIVDCKDENEQLKLIEKLEKQKYRCRASSKEKGDSGRYHLVKTIAAR